MNKNPLKLIMSEVGCLIHPILPGHPLLEVLLYATYIEDNNIL